jgi:hypothetical protein
MFFIAVSYSPAVIFVFSGHIHDLFHTIEKYSPFHDFLESDEDYIARLKAEHEAAQADKKLATPGVRSERERETDSASCVGLV